jgi:hypothetical protein
MAKIHERMFREKPNYDGQFRSWIPKADEE